MEAGRRKPVQVRGSALVLAPVRALEQEPVLAQVQALELELERELEPEPEPE